MKIAQMTVAQMTVAQMYTDLRNECRAAQARAAELEARAEAAEARAVELINANNELARLNVDLQVQAGDLKAKLTSDEADENAWLDAYAESSARDGATIKRLLARAAELEAQLAAMQTAACPHCGKSLAGENLGCVDISLKTINLSHDNGETAR